MTSSPTAGYQGVFKISATALVQVQSIDLTINGKTYDTTIMSGTSTPPWETILPGTKSWKVKVSALYDQQNDAVQSTAWSNFGSGTICALTFSANGGTNNFTGNAYVEGLPIKADLKAAETIDLQFTGSGALSYA